MPSQPLQVNKNQLEEAERAENQQIVARYRRLLRTARPMLNEGDAVLIRKAFETALEAHRGMRRKSGEPYIYHPIAVAQIAVEEIGLGTTSIIAALLHDVVEDTEMELAEIEQHFGPKVARIIDGLTKIAGVFQYGTSQQAENFRKMLLTLSDDVRVILIKLADRLHNMRTLDAMPRNTQLKIASETIYLYAPLAHRLGLYTIKTELEDLYLKYTETDTYKEIATKLQQTKAGRGKFIKDFIAPLESELERQGHKITIKGRPKSIYSIFNKMRKQKVGFEDIYDLFAIRIIIDTELEMEKSACWQVYSIITDFYKPNPDRLRDWVSTPRGNGYESLHTTVMSKSGQWVEVQIRTRRMDEIAEKGYAAHWKYKEAGSTGRESGLELWITRVREMLEKSETSAIEFVNDFRNNLFSDEVYVFTPNGDLKILPAGSSALDFAFEIHTQVGSHCLGAKVNNKLVSISHKLKNGDQVEILTSNKQKPSEDWLRYVVTSKAIGKIKEGLREERRLIATQGREFVEKKLKGYKVEPVEETYALMRTFFQTKSNAELFYRFGRGQLDTGDVRRFRDFALTKPDGIAHPTLPEARQIELNPDRNTEKSFKKVKGVEGDVILIGDDISGIEYTLAQCCNPIRGDEVFGFVSVSEGIRVHRTTCPNAAELMSNYGYRIVKVKWTSQQEAAFLTGLRFTGTDRLGLINDITRVISGELKVNMRSITVETHEGVFEGKIMLYVSDTSHLDMLAKKLKRVDGVVSIIRFDY
jgi:GTP diphosphokinase / guanosine-3',5'-bis(diphosphate) 3'-diphosphatase